MKKTAAWIAYGSLLVCVVLLALVQSAAVQTPTDRSQPAQALGTVMETALGSGAFTLQDAVHLQSDRANLQIVAKGTRRRVFLKNKYRTITGSFRQWTQERLVISDSEGRLVDCLRPEVPRVETLSPGSCKPLVLVTGLALFGMGWLLAMPSPRRLQMTIPCPAVSAPARERLWEAFSVARGQRWRQIPRPIEPRLSAERNEGASRQGRQSSWPSWPIPLKPGWGRPRFASILISPGWPRASYLTASRASTIAQRRGL